VTLHHEVAGTGPDVVLIHPGIADSRIWDPQWSSFESYRRIRLDLPGFGLTPLTEPRLGFARAVEELLGKLEVSRAALVGTSVGGRTALELAIARPELVAALVLAGASLPDHDWSAEVRAYGEAEDEAVQRGDLDAATELNLRMWVDGPRRSPADVDPRVREAMRDLQRRALELQAPYWDTLEHEFLVTDLAERLAEVRAPTLVLVGEEDVRDIHEVADLLADAIPGARRATIPGAAHVPNLERPADFDALVLGFLGEVLPA
jgi:3-oxoadipate enol-lactonase